METISNGLEDYLIDGLSFKLPPGSSYITDRKKATYWATGSNIYQPLSGTKVIRFLINGDDGNWLDPQSVRVQFTIVNKDTNAGHNLHPLGNPHLFFRRVRILVGNQLAEDILDYNRCHEMFFNLIPFNVRDNIDAEGFGYRLDTVAAPDHTTYPGIAPGENQVVSFKLLSGLLSGQSKMLPIKFAPLVIELEIIANSDDALITPGVKISGNTNSDFTTDNTSTLWEINNVCIKADICTLDNSLNNSYIEHLLSGKALPIKFSTFINQQSALSGNTIAIQVARAVSRLEKCFITFYKTSTFLGTPTPTIYDKQAIKFYNPMEGNYSSSKELEFQIQLGSKLYPEYPCRSINECFTILKQALNLPEWHLHSVGITYKQYISNKFIFAMDFQKVPDSSWTGTNTKAGQLLIIKVNAMDKSNTGISGDIASLMFITLQSEQILEIRDIGCTIFD